MAININSMLILPTITHQQSNTAIACATIDVCADFTNKKSTQSLAVRQLLHWLQCQLNLSGTLIETAFPYYFLSQNHQQFFVCFSHSQNKVAVIISSNPCAIDIETKPVKDTIAKHFFHTDELAYLHQIPIHQQAFFRLVLWQLKENLVKLQGRQLIFWLKQNHSQLLHALQYDVNKQIIKFDLQQDNNRQQNSLSVLCHQAHQYSAIMMTDK